MARTRRLPVLILLILIPAFPTGCGSRASDDPAVESQLGFSKIRKCEEEAEKTLQPTSFLLL